MSDSPSGVQSEIVHTGVTLDQISTDLASIPATGQQGIVQFTPRVHVAEAAVGYRDRIGPLLGTPPPHLIPDYTSREGITAGLRVGRGFASIGAAAVFQAQVWVAPLCAGVGRMGVEAVLCPTDG